MPEVAELVQEAAEKAFAAAQQVEEAARRTSAAAMQSQVAVQQTFAVLAPDAVERAVTAWLDLHAAEVITAVAKAALRVQVEKAAPKR